jgi:hypothetical protein
MTCWWYEIFKRFLQREQTAGDGYPDSEPPKERHSWLNISDYLGS